MISAPSRLQRLSGNKGILLLTGICLLWSCVAPKTAVNKPSPDTPVTQTDHVRVYDPKTESYILVPRDAIRVDTIEWKESLETPLVTDDQMKEDKPSVKDKDLTDGFDIALLMPFDALHAEIYTERQDPKLVRFIQYYAGMMLAASKLDSLGIPIRIQSYDIANPEMSITSVLNQPSFQKADIIIGPYEKGDVEVTAAFGLEHEIPIVSPWLPTFNPSVENPYLIQLYPGLATHAQATMHFINRTMPGKKVYVVARDKQVEINRTQLFTRFGEGNAEELIIKDASPDLERTDLHTLLDDHHGTVFILPFYSKTDEAFVNSFMRKLHADKNTREAIVFGLPQWVGFSNLNPNYMESLSLHLSISAFTDVQSDEYDSFRNWFLHTYHTIPDQNAFQGYDLISWIGQTVSRIGIDGLMEKAEVMPFGTASGFDIQPVYAHADPANMEVKTPQYYENKLIRILKYLDKDFVLFR